MTQTQTQTQKCFRCDGDGFFGHWAHIKAGVCFRCNGTGIDPTPKKGTVSMTKTPILVPATDGTTFDLNVFADGVANVAKTHDETDVRNLQEMLLQFATGNVDYGFPVVPNVYIFLYESVSRVIDLRFGTSVPTEVPAVEEITPVVTETPAVPYGTYTLQYESGDHFTFRIRQKEFKGGLSNRKEMKNVIEFISGPNNDNDFQAFGFVNALPGKLTVNVWKRFQFGSMIQKAAEAEATLNGSNLEEAGIAYALTSVRCRRCNRPLTVPTSIHQGYGPECIHKI